MSVPMMAFAAPTDTTPTISVNSLDTHTYKVFQVLTGTLSEEGSKQLGNPEWGLDATSEAKEGKASDFITELSNKTSDADIAAFVAGKVNIDGDGRGTVNATTILDVVPGYYVLVDTTSPLEKGDSKSLHLVKVINNITVTPKKDTVQEEKTIIADTLGKDGNTYENGTSKDNVSVGDTVTFQIEASVPETAENYNYYYFVINDTLDKGLTLDPDSIKVYKESVAEGNILIENADDGYKLDSSVNDNDKDTFKVGLMDAKALAGKTIYVTYSATLNKYAEVGETPNKNESTVTYSNDPNHTYDGGETPGQNPGFPADKDKDVLGETPVSETETFTTGIEIQKVDENGNPLTGATFEISGESTKTVLTVSEKFEADDNGDYYKLKNGKYTKEAPTTQQTMEPAEAGATAGYVEDENGTVEVGGKKYREYVPATDEGKSIFVLVNGNADQYETGKYKKTVETKTENTATDHKVELAVDGNGIVRFDGLGAGTYTIKETATPAGYNTMSDLTVNVTFTADGTSKWSFSGGEGTYDQSEGIYKIEIKNNKGTELPETGGIGTTIFYVLGAILVIGAGVLLVTRRRMNAN